MEIKTLADRAVLVQLWMKGLSKSRNDLSTRNRVALEDGVPLESITVSRKLYYGIPEIKSAEAARYAVREYWKSATLAWGDGVRLLPAPSPDDIRDFRDNMKQVIEGAAGYESVVINNWADIVTRCVTLQNGKVDANDYPTSVEGYACGYTLLPVPSSGDFRTFVDPEDAARLDALIEQKLKTAQADLILRLLDPLNRFVERLTDFKGDKTQRWHHAPLQAVLDAVESVESINAALSQDARVEKIARAIRLILKPYSQDSEELRVSPDARAKTHNDLTKVAGILSKMGVQNG